MDKTTRWTVKPLPTEVWRIILDLIPLDTTRRCLSVCRLFHDLAAPLLFANLHVGLGSWRDAYGYTETPEQDEMRRHNSTSVLLRIINDPLFASYAKCLYITVFGNLFDSSPNATSFLSHLADAIKCLPNLRRLEWGAFKLTSIPTSAFMETVFLSCTRLCRIGLPLQSLNIFQAPKPLPITTLSIYHVTSRKHILETETEACIRYRPHLLLLLEACRESLVALSAPCQAIWDCPTGILRGLTHLTLTIETDDDCNYDKISLIFQHCVRLESLHIMFFTYDLTEFFAALAANTASLPQLTHLKLQICPLPRHAFAPAFRELCNFVSSKKHLRCLDYSDNCSSSMAQMSPFLSTLRSLPGLEVIGLDLKFQSRPFDQEDLVIIRRAIPDCVTALRLSIHYKGPALIDGHPWTDLWASFPRLAFAHIKDQQNNPLIRAYDLAAAVKSLQLIGHRARFYEVHRTENEIKLSRWAGDRGMFPAVEELGCDDWEWLMRWHLPTTSWFD